MFVSKNFLRIYKAASTDVNRNALRYVQIDPVNLLATASNGHFMVQSKILGIKSDIDAELKSSGYPIEKEPYLVPAYLMKMAYNLIGKTKRVCICILKEKIVLSGGIEMSFGFRQPDCKFPNVSFAIKESNDQGKTIEFGIDSDYLKAISDICGGNTGGVVMSIPVERSGGPVKVVNADMNPDVVAWCMPLAV